MAAKVSGAAVAACFLNEACNFVGGPSTSLRAQRGPSVTNAKGSSPAQGAEGSSMPIAAVTLAAGSALAFASAGRRTLARTVCRGILTTDSAGRDRFVVEGGAAPAATTGEKPYQTYYEPAYPKTVTGDVTGELGVTMPFKFWDPLGLSSDGDLTVFRRRRMAEIKNGRVAMIACIGYIVPEYFRFPGFCSPSTDLKFTDIPNGIAALYKIPAEGWAQMGVFVAFLELFPLRQEEDRAPGDFATCGKLGVPWFFVAGRGGSDSDPVANQRSLDAELNNGRLAMVAITGMISQNAFLGTTGPEMWVPSS